MSEGRYGERSLARAFARRLVVWARHKAALRAAASADDQVPDVTVLRDLHHAARALSHAIAAGHVCLPLAAVAMGRRPESVRGADAVEAESDVEDEGLVEGEDGGALRIDVRAAAPGPVTASSVAQLRATLRASGVVGGSACADAMPLILDEGDRLYLHRHFDLERRLARRLVAAAREPLRVLDAAACAAFDTVHPASARADARTRGQRLAVALALLRSLVVISGGPGTGKTTTVARLLACLRLCNPAERIAIAAPTGKAAARVEQSLREQGAIGADTPSAQTIHRLLGATQVPGVFRHGIDNPLPIDTLVVDEASMLDLALATQLLEAVPPGARIILLGDREQLASVEAGAVFAELSASYTFSAACLHQLARLGIEPGDVEPVAIDPQALEREALEREGVESRGIAPQATLATGAQVTGVAAVLPATVPTLQGPLVDAVVWLTENFRFDARSGPGLMATAIRAGRVDDLIGALRDPLLVGADCLVEAGASAASAVCARALDCYAPYLEALAAAAASGVSPEDALECLFARFEGFRVLCALRAGPRGVDAINAQIAAAVRRKRFHPDDPLEPSPWYAGRPVLVVRNDYTVGLFNGDTGITWPDMNGVLKVWFPVGEGRFRALSPARLPDHETAWALSVHKSQGSEFDRVLIVLPEEPHPLLSRELIYTAVTRARLGACLAGRETVIAEAARRPAWRASGLLARLREA